MVDKKDLSQLLKLIKQKTGLNQDDIAKRINYSREYLSKAKTANDQKLYGILVKEFAYEITPRPAAPGDQMNRERALIKMLMHRLAKAEAKLYNRPLPDVLEEMEADTTLYLNDLEREHEG